MKKVFALFLLTAAFQVEAAPVFTNSAVVNTVTNSATFDSLISNNLSLNAYTEDGISISVPDNTAVDFNAFNASGNTTAFHYGDGGNNSWVTISLTGGGLMSAIDFLLGDGWGNSTTNLIWETFNGASTTGFGNVVLSKGTTVGWTDSAGITSLRVAANTFGINAFGNYQAIALDDLRIGSASLLAPGEN